MDKNNQVILIGLLMFIIYLGMFFSFFSGFANKFYMNDDHSNAPYERLEIDVYKGLWLQGLTSPGNEGVHLREDVIDLGANTVGFGIVVQYSNDGTFNHEEIDEEIERMRQVIRYYKKAGLAVIFAPQPRDPGAVGGISLTPGENLPTAEYLENYKDVVVKFAKMAEEENVEIFSPLDEPDRGDRHLGVELSSEYLQELLPLVREVYSGKIMWKADMMESLDESKMVNLTGYDIVAFTSPIDQNVEGAQKVLDKKFILVEKWMDEGEVDELFGIGLGPHHISTNQDTAESVDLLFEKGLKFKKMNGFLVMQLGVSIQDDPLNEMVRDWFEKLE